MSDHQPETTHILTDAGRDDFRANLRQNLGYRAWVIEDTMLGHVERIVRERLAQAWDEGEAAGMRNHSAYQNTGQAAYRNPYGIASPPAGGES